LIRELAPVSEKGSADGKLKSAATHGQFRRALCIADRMIADLIGE
jgi:hypothetical protein